MSKQGFVEVAAQQSLVPSAPPSYDEAMQQAGAHAPMPGHSVQQPPMPMPMPMPMPTPQGMPMSPYPTQPMMPMPQPAPFYQPGLPPSTEVNVQTVHSGQTVVFTSLGKDSTLTVCHKCNMQVMTSTDTSNKCLAHCCCCILMCSVVGLLCSCLPYCIDSCKVVKHSCPNCKTPLGTYRP